MNSVQVLSCDSFSSERRPHPPLLQSPRGTPGAFHRQHLETSACRESHTEPPTHTAEDHARGGQRATTGLGLGLAHGPPHPGAPRTGQRCRLPHRPGRQRRGRPARFKSERAPTVQVRPRIPAARMTWAAFPLCPLAPRSRVRHRLWGSASSSARRPPHPPRGADEGQTRRARSPGRTAPGPGTASEATGVVPAVNPPAGSTWGPAATGTGGGDPAQGGNCNGGQRPTHRGVRVHGDEAARGRRGRTGTAPRTAPAASARSTPTCANGDVGARQGRGAVQPKGGVQTSRISSLAPRRPRG